MQVVKSSLFQLIFSFPDRSAETLPARHSEKDLDGIIRRATDFRHSGLHFLARTATYGELFSRFLSTNTRKRTVTPYNGRQTDTRSRRQSLVFDLLLTGICRLVLNTARRFAYPFAPALSRAMGVAPSPISPR